MLCLVDPSTAISSRTRLVGSTFIPYRCLAEPRIGNETQVVVEFSPYQKVPTERAKADNRIATIEEGTTDDICVPYCVIYTEAIQMKITRHSSSRWRTIIRSHLTRRLLSI